MRQFFTESDRLQAFSDGVLAIIITIMVLELRPPEQADLAGLLAVLPTLAAYALSFAFIGIYWNNHHHMMRASRGIDGRSMWANLHLLFWLSLIPFGTEWLGRHPRASGPTVVYATLLIMCALSYTILSLALIRLNGPDTPFARAVASDRKGRISLVIYAAALLGAFFAPWIAQALFVAVAIMWFVPDRRFEPLINRNQEES